MRSQPRKDQGQAFCKESRETSFSGGTEYFWMRAGTGPPRVALGTEHWENFRTSSRH